MDKKNVYILEDRGILYIHGEDSNDFLQNIITNDINKINENNSCFASLLTPQGKYLFDFIILKHKKGYFLDCEKSQIDKLYNQLNLYKLRSNLEILNLSNEFTVAALGREKFLSFENSKDQEGSTINYMEDTILLDPRSKELGSRLYINLEKLNISIKKLELNIKNLNEYYQLSYNLGIPQVGLEQLQNKAFGIECNFEELNGIDFKKGCYVGQENTSRIKIKNKLSKRLLPIKFIESKNITSDVITLNSKEIGKIIISNNFPFALFKLNNGKFNFKDNYLCENKKIEVIKPNWIN